MEEVYSDDALMRDYMHGLLVSQIIWRNHAEGFLFFRERFLARLTEPFDYLEVVHGHGITLAAAAQMDSARRVVGWT